MQKEKHLIVQEYSGLRFEEGVHLYYWNDRRIPKSVSGKVKEVVPEFDSLYWSEWCSKFKEEYKGKTPHEIVHGWQTTNQLACELGTETHEFLEVYKGYQTPQTPQQKAGVKFLLWLMSCTYEKDGVTHKKYEILFRELRMYSRKHDYAGTADLIVWDFETESVVIFDYKTNKDLFKAFGWMLAPFGHMPNHPYNHYQIQLSYYSLLLEEIGITVSERKIVYLMADEEYRIFDLDDYTPEIKEYLQPKKQLNEAW